ncbi:MAG: peroxiredoxin [Acidimicrobiales bacterium]
MTVGIGDVAPSFELEGTDGTEAGTRSYRLDEYAGQPVVLVFYPADNSRVCTRQLNSYTAEFDRFAAVDAAVLGISPQGVASHAAFVREQGGFAFPLLSDLDKAVGSAYGVLGPIGFYKRSVFVVDESGIIRYLHRATAGLTFRSTDEIVDAVRSLSG